MDSRTASSRRGLPEALSGSPMAEQLMVPRMVSGRRQIWMSIDGALPFFEDGSRVSAGRIGHITRSALPAKPATSPSVNATPQLTRMETAEG